MNPFSSGLARNDTFCNRTAQIALLKRNITSKIHTVIYAPRRYGKTSLAQFTLEQIEGVVSIYIDLFKVDSSDDVAEAIYRGIVAALGKRAADKSSVGSRIASFFKRLRLGMEFNPTTGLPEFSVSLGNEPAEVHLETIIQSLDAYCEDQGIKVCIVLDEFQEICNLKESKKIEAMLRGGMQTAEHITFIMMGSRRTILRDMFEDRKRPFYKSAMIFELPPISKGEFIAFLVNLFKKNGVDLTEQEAAEIVSFTDSYPYHTWELARLYFDMKQEGISLEEAQKALITSEAGDFEGFYAGLTNHQKRLLRSIARLRPENIFGHSFLVAGRLGSQGGVQTSLAKLKKLDLVEQRDGRWRVVDPVFEKWLLE